MILTRRRRKILGLIADEDKSATEVAEAGGFCLGPLYGLLRRMERAGLLTSRIVPRPRMPDHPRRIYSITDSGRDAIASL